MTENKVEIRVTARNDTKPGLSSSKSDVERFSADFDRLITKSLKDGETGFDTVTKKAEGLRTELDRMRSDFARTGNGGLFGDIKKSEKDLAFLEDAIKAMEPRVRAEFRKMGDDAGREGGEHAGDEFIKGLPFGIGKGAIGIGKALTSAIEKLAPQVAEDAALMGEKAGRAFGDGITSGADAAAQDIPQLFTPEGAIGAAIVGGLIATLAPAAASAIGLALTLGVGAAVIGVGAVIEHNTPRVADALGALKDRAIAVMKDAAWPLVEPFHDALVQLDQWIHDEGGQFSDIFTAAAPGVKGITTDILGLIQATLPGVEAITRMFSDMADDPQMQAAFEHLGTSISDVFQTIADNKQTIEDTFSVLTILVGTAITMFDVLLAMAQGFDTTIRAIATPFEWLAKQIGLVGDSSDATLISAKDNTQMLVPVVHEVAQTYDQLAASLSKTAATADTLAGSLADKAFGMLMSSDQATLHWNESLTSLSKTLHDNSNALSIHTAKGQADREAILGAVQANIAQYDSMIAAGLSAKDAADAYDTNTKALEKQLRAAGLLQPQIDGIIGKYKKVPDKVNTTIAMLGLEKAIEDLNTTLKLINGLRDKTVTLHVNQVAGPGPARASAGEPLWKPPPTHLVHPSPTPSAHASGGVAGGLTWLGERGAELVRLPQGSTVYPAGQSQVMAGQQAAPAVSVGAQLAFVGNADTAFAAFVQRMFRDGKIQLVVGGQRVKVG